MPQVNILKTEPQFPEQQHEIQEAAPSIRPSLVTSKHQIKLVKSNPELRKTKLYIPSQSTNLTNLTEG